MVNVVGFDGATVWREAIGKPAIRVNGRAAEGILENSPFDDPIVGIAQRGASARLASKPGEAPIRLRITEKDGTVTDETIDPASYEELSQIKARPGGTKVELRFRDYRKGGVVSPLLSNILLTPFDKEMRRHGYCLTRWADDWVVTCRTRAAAEHALDRAAKILEKLGVVLNREKTRIVHIAQGFEFLGFKIGRGKGKFKLNRDRITSKLNRQNLYAIPTQKSLDRFKDQIRAMTKRKIPLRLGELIETINPIIRGWGNYYCRSHVRKRFHQLDGWIIRRLWSHRTKRWRNAAWKVYPTKRLRGEFKLVSLVSLDSFASTARAHS